MYNFDLQAIYTSWLASVEDDQGPSGDAPFVVPGGEPGASSCTDIAWTTVYPQMVSFVGEYYGDSRLADRHWTSLSNYTDNLLKHAAAHSHGLATCDQFLDWVTAGTL